MENEVASIRAASKGQGFIYRTGAIPLEEDGPLAPTISVKGAGAWARWPHSCCTGETSTGVFTKISPFGEDERGEKVSQT